MNPEERRKLLTQCISFSFQDVCFIANIIAWLFSRVLFNESGLYLSEEYKQSVDRSIGDISSEGRVKVDVEYFNKTFH